MGPVGLGHAVRRADVLWRRSGDRVLIRRPGHDEVAVLTGSGVDLWHKIAAPIEVDELCAELAGAHGLGLDDVVDDVISAVTDLLGRGLVMVDG